MMLISYDKNFYEYLIIWTSIKSLSNVQFIFRCEIQHKDKYPGGKSSPEIYKEYEWTFDKKGNDDCKHKRDKQYGSYFTGPRFIDEFMMCMNMKLPTPILKEMQCPSYWSVQKWTWQCNKYWNDVYLEVFMQNLGNRILAIKIFYPELFMLLSMQL